MTETLLLDHDEVHTSRMPIPSIVIRRKTPAIMVPLRHRHALWLRSRLSAHCVGEQVSPNRKCSLDLFEEGRPLLSGGMIHIVVGEVVAAHGVAWH